MVWGGSMLYSFEYMKDIQRSIRNIELEALKEKNILITGAAGLIGSALVDILLYLNKKHGYRTQIYVAVRNLEKARLRFIL